MKKIKSILALTRWNETYDFNIALALLGAIAAGGSVNYVLILVWIANFLCLSFAFMINDIEDAEEDAQNPKKLKRNVISNKSLSKKEGYLYTGIAGLISLVLYIYLAIEVNSLGVLLSGVALLLVNFFYSYRKVRLKAIPVIDLLAHIFMLAAGEYLVAYYAFNSTLNTNGTILLLILCGISAYGQLENETRDFETDVKTHIKTTATVIGLKLSNLFKYIILSVSALGFIGVIFFSNLIEYPFKTMLNLVVLFSVFAIFAYMRFRRHKDQVVFSRELQQGILLVSNICMILAIYKIYFF